MTLLNGPTSAESSMSETTAKKSKRKGIAAFGNNGLDSPPEPPGLVVAATKATGNRVGFELTTIVVNADGIPDGYRSYPAEMAC